MPTTATRVLRLLALLQARRDWSGADLSARLEVDVRTVRRDVDRLRELGYSIESSTGLGGGYRLSAGARTPPLLLDDQEALTVAIALSIAAGTSPSFTDTALRVLVKLDQLLPTRLRRRWIALNEVALSLENSAFAVDTALLAKLAAACRDQKSVAFEYDDRKGQATSRNVEPMRLVHTGRVWYLVAWDLQRADWRTFRVDRIDSRASLRLGKHFAAREPPGGFAAYVSHSISASPHRYRARLKLAEPIHSAKKHIPTWLGVLEPVDERHCILSVGADNYDALVALIVHAGVDFELLGPLELAKPLRAIGARLARGLRGGKAKTHQEA